LKDLEGQWEFVNGRALLIVYRSVKSQKSSIVVSFSGSPLRLFDRSATDEIRLPEVGQIAAEIDHQVEIEPGEVPVSSGFKARLSIEPAAFTFDFVDGIKQWSYNYSEKQTIDVFDRVSPFNPTIVPPNPFHWRMSLPAGASLHRRMSLSLRRTWHGSCPYRSAQGHQLHSGHQARTTLSWAGFRVMTLVNGLSLPRLSVITGLDLSAPSGGCDASIPLS
jgi:hypothetical protein